MKMIEVDKKITAKNKKLLVHRNFMKKFISKILSGLF